MADAPNPDPVPSLASLRRRGVRRRAEGGQSSLFSDLLPTESGLFPAPQEEPLDPAATATAPRGTATAAGDSKAARAAAPARTVPDPGPAVAAVVATPVVISGPRTPEPGLDAEPAPGPEERPRTWTVSGLVRHVRGVVERGYSHVTVEGEISNWRPSASGHGYFTLKDAGAQLSAVIFRRQASLLRFRPLDGHAVRLHGQLSVYESRGQMQILVEWMEQVGLGALLAQVQRLKERLRQEGLFDRKRPLPPFPRCIGIITSLQGAALRDIVKVCRRRHASVHLLIYPAAVQGPNCPAEIAAGLRWFNAHPDRAEVLLVARGGGSWEDLHGFDDEAVARAIAGSVLPVITGIGHATDSTIADAAADVCAPTPSAAAELLTAAQHQVEERIGRLHTRLLRAGSFELLRAQQRLARLGAATVLRRVEDALDRRAQRLDELQFRAEAALQARMRRHEVRLRLLASRLDRQNPALRLADTRQRLAALNAELHRSAHRRIADGALRLDRSRTRVEALSPLRVLERGYALVYGPQGHLLRDPSELAEGDAIRARLASGEVHARVLRDPDSNSSHPRSLSGV